jgi:hypothetical protein
MARQNAELETADDDLAERAEAGASAEGLAVQRYTPPQYQSGDEEWFKHTLYSGGAAASGYLGAIPGIGNTASAFTAAAHGVAGLSNLAAGRDEQALKHWHGVENNMLNALPIVGNIRSLTQGVHDGNVFYDDLTGASTTPQYTSGESFHKNQGPKLDAVLDDFFRQI